MIEGILGIVIISAIIGGVIGGVLGSSVNRGGRFFPWILLRPNRLDYCFFTSSRNQQ